MIIRLIISIILFYLVYRIGKLLFLPGEKKVHPLPKVHQENLTGGEDLVEDPYCHTYIPISTALSWQGPEKRHYFCSSTCLDKYRKNHENGGKQEEI
jgi:YHS domain-containing protein